MPENSNDFFNSCDQSFKNRDKPKWSDHNYPAICLCGNGNWFGLKEAEKPPYSDEFKGREVHLLSERCGFLKYGTSVSDIDSMYEVRPT